MKDFKTGELLSPADASAMAKALLELGLSPKVVRLRLAERGIHWAYTIRGQGSREMARRLKQQGQGLCPLCHERGYALDSIIKICPECLQRKWSTVEQVGPSALEG